MAIQHIKRFQIESQSVKPFSPLFFFYSSFSSNTSNNDTKTQTLVSVLTHQRSKSRWNALRYLCPNGIDPTQFSQITIQLKNNPHLALRFFNWTQSNSICHHTLSSYSTIIHLFARARLYKHAYHTIRTAIRTSQYDDEHCRFDSPPLNLFETLVKTYQGCGSSPFVFDLLIKACLESKKLDPSIEIVRMLLSRGISPKVTTLNSLIFRVCKSRGFDAGYAIYREIFRLDDPKYEISKRGSGFKVNPNVHTYNELMLCCYQDALFEKVGEIWNEMECAPNTYSYTLRMASLCDEGRVEDAEKLWEEMRNKRIEPDVISYNTMMGGFCNIGDVGRAEEFYREMTSGGIESTASTYDHLVKGYCNIGDVDSAVLVYKDMYRKDFCPVPSTIDVVTRLLCDKGRVKEALQLVRNATGKFGLVPKGNSYETLIKGLCAEGRMEEAFKIQAEMVGKGFHPNSKIYAAFIDGHVRQGNEELAGALRKEMLQTQIQS
ncbi:hypothetical protein Lal_00034539 [Lupinus albus]|nr:hypothetical protein Lal_00034539 [Lupinus albus]